MKKTVAASLFSLYLLFTSCSQQQLEDKSKDDTKIAETKHVPWSYEGKTGSEHWGELSTEFILCKNGAEQSPIHIQEMLVGVNESLPNLTINYHSTGVSIINDGRTIRVNAAAENNKIKLGEKEYKLAQFHFHTPSEHQLNSQSYDMELHLIHEDKKGRLLVLAVFVQEGTENESFLELISKLPEEQSETEVQLNQAVNLYSILPNDYTTFRYDGSLTTPPCTERVKWLVFEQPIEMSKEQINAFQTILLENNRPIQPQNEREIAKKYE
jgi:carbonic anhydrase